MWSDRGASRVPIRCLARCCPSGLDMPDQVARYVLVGSSTEQHRRRAAQLRPPGAGGPFATLRRGLGSRHGSSVDSLMFRSRRWDIVVGEDGWVSRSASSGAVAPVRFNLVTASLVNNDGALGVL